VKKWLLGLCLVIGMAEAAPEIFVAYPRNDYQVAFDHVLLEGSVTPGASLSLNGKSVDTGTDGLFIEWVPLEPGLNVLKLESSLSGEKATLEYRVTSKLPVTPETGPTQIVEGSLLPSEDSVFYVPEGQMVYVRMRGSPGGEASFTVGDKGPFALFERKKENFSGKVAAGLYEGFYLVQPTDQFEGAAIQVQLKGDTTVKAAALGKLTVRNQGPRVGIFTGKPLEGISSGSDVARNAPGRGYVLYPREGTKFWITGEVGTTFEARLSPGQNVYIPKNRLRLLPEGSVLPKVFFTTIQTKRVEGATQVRYLLPEVVPFSVIQGSGLQGSGLEVKLFYTYSDIDYMIFANPDPVVRDIQWTQEQDALKTSIALGAQQWGYKTFYENNTLVLQLRDAPNIDPSQPLKGRKITVDAGHGGPDGGGAGSLRLPEKDIVLKISLLLADILQQKGATVHLTRDKDVEIGLFDRSSLADKAGSEVLVSVHANGIPDGVDPGNLKGIGVYYFQPHSRSLAQAVHTAMVGLMPEMGNDGVRYQNLALTRPTQMPQILVETGYLTNKQNLRFLMSEAGQRKMAEGMAKGLEAFFAQAK
jgi:N-acetylmuramoyl-L-alanine amidase